jgi:adenylate cyclase class 2
MAKSSRENEIKLAFATPGSAILALVAAGATIHRERVFEDNMVFDLPDRTLTRSGRLLRLRRSGDESVLTFKAPVEGDHRHKLRIEHETPVADADAAHRIISGLGYEPIYRYQKFRSCYRVGNIEAVVDETPIGTFVELEGEPDELDRVASALGVSPADYIRETYRELHERHAAALGQPVGDLLMRSEDSNR